MAYEIPCFKLGTEVAASDLSSYQFYALKVTASGVALAGAGEAIVGILQNKPISGEAAEIVVSGVSKAVSGAAFSKGALLEVDANGKLIAASSTIGYKLVGIALEAATGANQVVSVLLKDLGIQ